MMSGMHITTDLLRERGATCDHLKIFAAEWPDGVEMTPASLRRAGELHLDMGWVWYRLLLEEPKDEVRFRLLNMAYWGHRRQIDKSWDEQHRQLDEAHRKQHRPLEKAYLERLRPIDEAFWSALAELMAESMEERTIGAAGMEGDDE